MVYTKLTISFTSHCSKMLKELAALLQNSDLVGEICKFCEYNDIIVFDQYIRNQFKNNLVFNDSDIVVSHKIFCFLYTYIHNR